MASPPPNIITGNIQMDKEHERLFMIEDELLSLCQSGSSSHPHNCDICDVAHQTECVQKSLPLLDELLYLAYEHFVNEEQYMSALSPAEAEEHKFQHAELSSKLSALAKQCARDAQSVRPKELSHQIKDYLLNHVEGFDLTLADAIRKK